MPSATHIAAPHAELEDWPIPAEQIAAGQPRARGTVLHDGPEGTGCGVWECTPGTFDWVYDTHQSLCVLSGEAEVEIAGGARLTLAPGDAAFFPAGTRARWTVRQTLRKVYTTYR